MIVLNHWRTVAAFLSIFTVGAAVYFVAAWSEERDDRDRRLIVQIVEGQRKDCERHNILRANQAFGLRTQIATTERSLKTPGGLNGLEKFREQIEEQLATRKRGLRQLLVSAADAPDPQDPYRVDCEHAHPLP